MSGARQNFSLTGRSAAFDPRVDAVRGDLADVTLASTHFAPHYAQAVERYCGPSFAALRDQPDGAQTSELLAGEGFMLLDVSGGWAWGWCAHDHYVGYVEQGCLDAVSTSLDLSGDIGEVQNNPLMSSEVETLDPATAALAFLDTPYLLGGRGGAGIDCSGLVQRAFAATGVDLPRDSDMQQALGQPVDTLQRNDLVGFAGHIGIMEDGETLIHATAHWGKVVREPLADVAARTPILTRKRL